MSTYTQILYQIVFSTKNREKSLQESERDQLYSYIWGILKKKKCHLYRIGGVDDHLHIVTHLHPMIAPSILIKDIKIASSRFIKEEELFPSFNGWQDGFGAFTYSNSAKNELIEYVKNQSEHHKTISFRDEYIAILKENGIDFDEKYLF